MYDTPALSGQHIGVSDVLFPEVKTSTKSPTKLWVGLRFPVLPTAPCNVIMWFCKNPAESAVVSLYVGRTASWLWPVWRGFWLEVFWTSLFDTNQKVLPFCIHLKFPIRIEKQSPGVQLNPQNVLVHPEKCGQNRTDLRKQQNNLFLAEEAEQKAMLHQSSRTEHKWE